MTSKSKYIKSVRTHDCIHASKQAVFFSLHMDCNILLSYHFFMFSSLLLWLCCYSTDWLGSYKGEGIVSGTPENVWECLKPVPNGLRVKWDSNVKRFELLEQIKEVCILSDSISVLLIVIWLLEKHVFITFFSF